MLIISPCERQSNTFERSLNNAQKLSLYQLHASISLAKIDENAVRYLPF